MVSNPLTPEHPKSARVGRQRRRSGSNEPAENTLQPLNSLGRRALIIDLNNFSTFPTLAVGILVAALRNAGFQATVMCPLAYGVIAAERERRETSIYQIARRIHHTTWPPLR